MEVKKTTAKKISFVKENSFVLLLILFVMADIFSYALIFSQNKNLASQEKNFIQKDSLQNFDVNNIPKISDIKGPQIDNQAASIEITAVNNSKEKTMICSTLPIKIWIFIFLAYVALLIFNLAYNFKDAAKIQWFWELLYTLLAVAVWYIFDSQKINIWYPIFILKSGILIYAVYLYFFNKKQK
jgi:hypothetical protein